MDQVAEIREKVDIVQLLSEYITLKKAGRNFKANCPFHSEKSPSFMISPERGMWHCFGCQKGGDAYSFLMDYEHMEFPEALRFLAKRVGVELVQSPQQSQTASKKETLYKINSLAAEFYHYILTKHAAGKPALGYIQNRAVSEKVIESFKIGFAPNTRNALANFLMSKKNFSADELLEAGLVSRRGSEIVDFFWGRIMFPLYDHRDNVVGFSGRILSETSTGPKYINTRETLVYHKGELFFGLNMTKDSIRKHNQAILVEGEFDVLSMFQHGISNVVAVKGTALTESQVLLLSRFAQKVTICFDGDAAGKEAIKRSLPIIEKKGLQTTVIVIPSGKDPDEALKTDAVAFKKAAEHDIAIYDWLLDVTSKAVDLTSPEGKAAVATEMLTVIRQITNEIVKEHYLRKLSTVLDTTYESIQKELNRLQIREVTPKVTQHMQEKKSREEVLEEYLLALIVQSHDPKIAGEKAAEVLSELINKERAYQKILFHLLSHIQEAEKFNNYQFISLLPSELVPMYDTSLLFPLSVLDGDQMTTEIEKTAVQLRILYVKDRMKVLSQQIKEKEKENDEEGITKLHSEYSTLASLLQK